MPLDRFPLLLAAANERLSALGVAPRLEQRRSGLYLRGTFPARDGSGRRKQTRIPLGLKATPASLPEAEAAALRLGRELLVGAFSWAAWAPQREPASSPRTREAAEATLRAYLEARYDDPARLANAWSATWGYSLRQLPDGPLSEGDLLRITEALPAKSRGRKTVGYVLGKLAELWGWDPAPLRAAGRGYGARSLTPRDIPEDGAVEAAWAAIEVPHWRWTFGAIATWGLRPSEVIDIEIDDADNAVVDQDTKTGARLVWPNPSSWVEKFGLREIVRPPSKRLQTADSLRMYLKRIGIDIQPYSLRHAYAVRTLKAGVPTNIGAKLMGHSPAMHTGVYQRWVSAQELASLRGRYAL